MPLLDPPLTPPPKIKLSRLRDIGWSVWDPIGLIGAEQHWSDEDCLSFADEYDSYLLQAAGRLRRGEAASDVASYLAKIEVEYIGLRGPFQVALAHAEKVVAAIQADAELWTNPD
jgi:hypothetical protein